MNVVQVSWSDHLGGAAIAASRLNVALNQFGVSSAMISGSSFRDADGNLQASSWFGRIADRLSARIDQLPLVAYRNRRGTLFTPGFAPERTTRRLAGQRFDIAHLHWVSNGFLKIENFPRLHRPTVWTLHDMWGFTGGCHYAGNCRGYERSCGACPQLGSDRPTDLSHKVLARKAAAWSDLKITIVTPSHWLADVARSSALFARRRVEVIPNALDTEAFAPQERVAARALLGLPAGAVILLFGALTGGGDQRKGFHLLQPTLRELAARAPQVPFHLTVFGVEEPARPLDVPFPITYLGMLNEHPKIVATYGAADVLIVPSIEDNLPNTVMEAASCGLPSVAFNTGGLPDLITHRKTGYLAQPFEPADLARGILWLTEDRERQRGVAKASRDHVLGRYAPMIVASQHASLYEQILDY